MKLPIKKKYFDKIKSGKKMIEWRDAHITFVCEETGETLVKNVVFAKVYHVRVFKKYGRWHKDMTQKEIKEMFPSNWIICFQLQRERKK